MYADTRKILLELKEPSTEVDADLSRIFGIYRVYRPDEYVIFGEDRIISETDVIPYTSSMDAVMALIVNSHPKDLGRLIHSSWSFLTKEGAWHIRFPTKEEHRRWPIVLMMLYLEMLDERG